jgi:hypothetical protein
MALTRTVTYQLAAAAAVGAFVLAKALSWGLCGTIAAVLVAAYLPSFFDGSEFTAEGRPWRAFADHSIFKNSFSWFPATLSFEEKLDPNKQYIFASAPHGVYSLHHGMLITNGVVCAPCFASSMLSAYRPSLSVRASTPSPRLSADATLALA